MFSSSAATVFLVQNPVLTTTTRKSKHSIYFASGCKYINWRNFLFFSRSWIFSSVIKTSLGAKCNLLLKKCSETQKETKNVEDEFTKNGTSTLMISSFETVYISV